MSRIVEALYRIAESNIESLEKQPPIKLNAVELQNLSKEEILQILEDAPVGSTIDNIYDNWWLAEYLKEHKKPTPTIVEKHGGYVRNYYAPTPTSNYEEVWTVGDSKYYYIANIIRGKDKYYSVHDEKEFSTMLEALVVD